MAISITTANEIAAIAEVKLKAIIDAGLAEHESMPAQEDWHTMARVNLLARSAPGLAAELLAQLREACEENARARQEIVAKGFSSGPSHEVARETDKKIWAIAKAAGVTLKEA